MAETSTHPTLGDRFRAHARPMVRVAMEPRRDHVINFAASLHAEPDGPGEILARCGDHGPPVVWNPPAPTAG